MQPLIECVPNISEGRRPEVVRAVADAAAAVPGAAVLDWSLDGDHNRAVITLAAPPEAVVQAAFALVAAAAERIDLRQHSGAHPRVGAADVVPLVPLRGATMAECVALARSLGERVGAELALPVYLYEEAAHVPARRSLTAIRNLGYERLAECITQAEYAPDYGPARLGPAGAVMIGARKLLIAYNIFLDTPDVEIAKQIAAAVRASSGGLPAVKALGMLVQGQAQVSMNLVDFNLTSLHAIQEAVRAEAGRRGCSITHAQIIGLPPRQALMQAAYAYLGIPGPPAALEDHLDEAFPCV